MARKRRQILLAWFMAVCLLLTACTKTPVTPGSGTRAEFDAFLEELFLDYVTSDTLTLHSQIARPEDYGIEYEASWGNYGRYPTDEEMAKAEAQRKTFTTFDRASLTPEQQESYDILAYDFALHDASLKFYYYGEPLSTSGGNHVMIPITLSQYEFLRERDVDDYLTLLETIDGLYDSFIRFEQEKAARGLFMTDSSLDDVLAGCEGFLENREDNILITSFDSRMEKLDGLDQAAKDVYMARNKQLFETVVVPAYEKLTGELKLLRGSGVNSGGLAGFDGGRDYYRYRLLAMGTDRPPEEWISIMDRQIFQIFGEIMVLLQNNSTLYYSLFDGLTPAMTAEEIVGTLRNKSAGDFPALSPDVSYTVNPIDDSLKKWTAPAFYFTPQLDNYKTNAIYYNADSLAASRDQTFFTLAHEGYPGHLLQQVNLMESDHSNFRKATFYASYVEGWATYTEEYAYKYVDAGEAAKRYLQLESALNLVLQFRIDLGVHYEGWTASDLEAYYQGHYLGASGFTRDSYEGMLAQAIKYPIKTAYYVTGAYEIKELAARYKMMLGDDYSDALFHEEFLSRGAAPFSLIRQWMDNAFLKRFAHIEGNASPGGFAPLQAAA